MLMQSDFDIAALSYDKSFTNTSIGKAQRTLVHHHLKDVLYKKKNQHILELNCGTGEDASYFDKLEHTVVATDVSKNMVVVAKQKNIDSTIEFKQMDINKISQQKFSKKFDVIFSNFGGFNCLSSLEIKNFFSSTKQLLTKNGKIVLVIMPKKTAWEKLYFSLKGNFKEANRRNTTKSIKANVDGVLVNTWYYNPKEIVKFASDFSVVKTKPVGLFIPPSYLQKSFLGNTFIVAVLKRLDFIFSSSFLANYADHFYIELQKKQQT